MATPQHAEGDRHARLVAALRDPAVYAGVPAPGEAAAVGKGSAEGGATAQPIVAVDLIETHISSVLLAGAFAYKLKKPVRFGFIDFSTLQKRRRYCDEELRLNRRTAPQLYLDVVPITGTIEHPRIGGDGEVLDYAVRMHRFPADSLLDRVAKVGALQPAHVDRLAERIAHFHAAAQVVAPDAVEGTTGEIWRWTHENFVELRRHRQSTSERARFESLADWTRHEFERLRVQFVTRRIQGQVRECHGDLHLGNVVLLDGEPVPFDCIEFNPALSGIDVLSDLALPFVDLFAHGLPNLAWRLVNRYLEIGGDYAGIEILRFYAVYRALVRAKVARIRSDADHDEIARAAAEATFARHVALAQALSLAPRPALLLMYGFPASGKSTVALQLAEELGGIRVRSDVERKRLFGVPANRHPPAEYGADMYSAEATRRTYARLSLLVGEVAHAGYPVIVDASFSRRADRAEFIDLARRLRIRCSIIECTAGASTLEARLAARAKHGTDASDATLDVLQRRLEDTEALTSDERPLAWRIATDTDPATLATRTGDLARRWDEAGKGSG